MRLSGTRQHARKKRFSGASHDNEPTQGSCEPRIRLSAKLFNLTPRDGSKRSTAWINPMVPTDTRSSVLTQAETRGRIRLTIRSI